MKCSYVNTNVHYCVYTDAAAARPSGVSACISYNDTGFSHLNLQWEVATCMNKYVAIVNHII